MIEERFISLPRARVQPRPGEFKLVRKDSYKKANYRIRFVEFDLSHHSRYCRCWTAGVAEYSECVDQLRLDESRATSKGRPGGV